MLIQATLFAHTLRVLTGLEPGGAEGEIEIAASEHLYIQASYPETVVRARPWIPFKRVGTVSDGTRFVVRGVVESRDKKGCHGKPWYAVYPFGFICSEHVRPSKRAPDRGRAVELARGRRVPFEYAYVRNDGVPMYAGYADIDAGIPTRPLTKGMSLVVLRSLEYDGSEWVQVEGGSFVPKAGIRYGGQGSEWAGVELSGAHSGPSFAWTRYKKGTSARAAPSASADKRLSLPLRTRVPLLERADAGDTRFWRVGDDLWIDADDLNEVHLFSAPPRDVVSDARRIGTGSDQWIDVDLGEQVLVAYRGDRAMFATLISSGKGMPTPRGNYPVWAKVASTTMANQAYEDSPYMVQGVPWVLLFQGHNALHGAYWHNNFGNRKSHGCVNLAPYDARWIFEWTGPAMPAGWTGFLPSELPRSTMVHVRDSSRAEPFVQERPIGPPDREAEQSRAEQAEERRELAGMDRAPVYDPAFVAPELMPNLPSEGEEAGGGAHLEPRESTGVALGQPG